MLTNATKDWGRVRSRKSLLKLRDGREIDIRPMACFFYDQLSRAMPFILPIDGDFGLEGRRQVTLAEARPPFPHTALQVTFSDDYRNKWGNRLKSAIVLLAERDDKAVTVSVVYDEVGLEGSFCMEALTLLPGCAIDIHPDGATDIDGMEPTILVERPEWDSFEAARADTQFVPIRGKFISITADFITLLSCANVSIKDAPVSKTRLQMERTRAKRPFLAYKILELPESGSERSDEPKGTHASPRFHVRRGHIRRLATGRNTWVRSCTVGSVEDGVLLKDYRLNS